MLWWYRKFGQRNKKICCFWNVYVLLELIRSTNFITDINKLSSTYILQQENACNFTFLLAAKFNCVFEHFVLSFLTYCTIRYYLRIITSLFTVLKFHVPFCNFFNTLTFVCNLDIIFNWSIVFAWISYRVIRKSWRKKMLFSFSHHEWGQIQKTLRFINRIAMEYLIDFKKNNNLRKVVVLSCFIIKCWLIF